MQDGIANQPPWPLFPLASSSTLACVCSTVSMNGKRSSPAPALWPKIPLTEPKPAPLVVAGERRLHVNNLIYLVGLVVVVLAILSFFGLG